MFLDGRLKDFLIQKANNFSLSGQLKYQLTEEDINKIIEELHRSCMWSDTDIVKITFHKKIYREYSRSTLYCSVLFGEKTFPISVRIVLSS